MALALYRKYRPASFADVVGQEHVTEPLRTALSAGRINHAYLFSGPRGCGKTSSARILARSLNCEQGPTADPCGICNSCVALAPEGSGNIDVIELDAASHGGVDDTRELRDRAFYAPAESRYRVFIVDEAHMVTTQGFNALLKIVEEPPDHLIFIFATTEPDKVLPTIRSRTHHYPFRLIPPGTLRALLERICADESATVAAPVFPLVIRAGGGSARDSLSVLDQLLAGAGPEGVTYERAVALLGVTDVALIDDTVDALAALDGAAVFEAVDRLVEAGHDPRRFAADLLERLRDLMLIQAVPEAAARGLVSAPADEVSRMADQAARLGAATLTRYAEILHTGLTEMRGATSPRLLLELLCARMLLPAASTEDAALLQRLETMERRIDIAPPAGEQRPAPAGEPTRSVPVEEPRTAAEPARTAESTDGSSRSGRTFERPGARSAAGAGAGAVAEPSRTVAERSAERAPAAEPSARVPVADAPAVASADAAAPDAGAPVAGGLDAAAVRRVWPEVLAAAKDASRSTGAMLMNAQVKALDDGTLVLGINSAPLARRLSESRNTEVIGAALRRVLGVDWRVRCEHDDGTASGGTPSSGGGSAHGGAAGGAAAGGAAAGGGAQAPAQSGGGSYAGAGQAGGSQSGGTPAGGSYSGQLGGGSAHGAASSGGGQPGGPPSGGSGYGGSQSGSAQSGGSSYGGGRSGSAPGGGSRSGGGSGGSGGPPSGGYERPSAAAGAARRATSAPPSVPLPPEPPSDEEEEEMLAEASASGGAAAPRRDPEEVAIELLAAQLGARTVDDPR